MVAVKSIAGSTCLVTGGSGFVGSNLVSALLAKGCKVRVLDRVACPVEDPRVTTIMGDLVEEKDVRRSLEGVDVVFHTAAIIELAERAPAAVKARVRAVNVDATRLLLDASESMGVERFVQTSSTGVVLAEKGAGGDESLPYSTYPDLYCTTKVAAEKLVRARNGARMKTV
jgi:3beta-hydroxy-delta5-steroid dehydrogenase/steroid delta-isomerase